MTLTLPLPAPLDVLLLPMLAVMVLLGVAAGAGASASSLLRRAALGSPGEGGVDWAALLGVAAGAWVLLLEVQLVAAASDITVGGPLSAVAGVLSSLTLAGATLAGGTVYRRRQLAAVPREAREALESELRPLEHGLIVLAALAASGGTFLGTLVVLAIAAVWAYNTPATRAWIESVLSPLALPDAVRTADPPDDRLPPPPLP